MKIDKATPGPWKWSRGVGEWELVGANADRVLFRWEDEAGLRNATVNGESLKPADAHLIAAAPDLLVACQTFAEWLRREEAGGTNEPWAGRRDTPEGEAAWRELYDENLRICDLAQEQARAAIAKATGEAP